MGLKEVWHELVHWRKLTQNMFQWCGFQVADKFYRNVKYLPAYTASHSRGGRVAETCCGTDYILLLVYKWKFYQPELKTLKLQLPILITTNCRTLKCCMNKLCRRSWTREQSFIFSVSCLFCENWQYFVMDIWSVFFKDYLIIVEKRFAHPNETESYVGGSVSFW
jgi:hypothetical protein